MTGKKIAGIILILASLVFLTIGGLNMIDLINMGNNPLVQLGLEAMGTSLGAQYIKYGIITLVGVALIITGIKLIKKPYLQH